MELQGEPSMTGVGQYFFCRDMAGAAGSYSSMVPYDPGDATGVLTHAACMTLGLSSQVDVLTVVLQLFDN